MLLFLSRGIPSQRPLPKQHKTNTICMSSAGLEPVIPEIERLHTNALDSRSTGISKM
jgi:hypothetical protein